MRYEIIVPPTADGALKVTITRWIKTVGSPVIKGEDLVEAITEKITLYIVAPADGTLAEILLPTGQQAGVGDVLGFVEGV
jgi:pyruvate/2-oxoglutarate dehydrogenase complex dihydrolipoamide acyltransferase (E2) component